MNKNFCTTFFCHWILRYCLAIGLTVIATLVYIKGLNLTSNSTALFYLAVTGSAYLGGHGPGILATVLSTGVFLYYFIPPNDSFAIHDSESALRLVFFAVATLFVSLLTSALNKARKEALIFASNRAHFVANITHEIRTPINAIVGLANILIDTPLNKEQAEYIRTIKQSGQALTNIINNILDFSKLEMVSQSREAVDFDLDQVVKQCVFLMKHICQAKNISISYLIKSPNHYLRGDSSKYSQILLNLLSNAVKFTNHGSIQVSIDISKNSQGLEVLTEVKDSGIGIAEGQQKKIFDEFYQIQSQGTSEGGAGLGLTISKRIVQILGGEIGVKSRLGLGSRFWFKLNFACPTKLDTNLFQEHKIISQKKVRVLVAEDNIVNQVVISKLLEKWGCIVDVVSNGQEAMQMFTNFPYRVVFLDCLMPIQDGYSAAAQITSHAKLINRPVAIIALTAYATKENEQKCYDSGMNYYITKPIIPENIFNLLNHIFERDSQPLPDLNDLAPELNAIYLSETPSRLEQLRKAIRGHDGATAFSIIHTIKSASGLVGDTMIESLCKTLEQSINRNDFEESWVLFSKMTKHFEAST